MNRRRRKRRDDRIAAESERTLARGFWGNVRRDAIPMYVVMLALTFPDYYLGWDSLPFWQLLIFNVGGFGSMVLLVLTLARMRNARDFLRDHRTIPIATPEVSPEKSSGMGDRVELVSEIPEQYFNINRREVVGLPGPLRIWAQRLADGALGSFARLLISWWYIITGFALLISVILRLAFPGDSPEGVGELVHRSLLWIILGTGLPAGAVLIILTIFTYSLRPTSRRSRHLAKPMMAHHPQDLHAGAERYTRPADIPGHEAAASPSPKAFHGRTRHNHRPSIQPGLLAQTDTDQTVNPT